MIIQIILIAGIVAIGLLALREKVSGTNLAIRRIGGVGIILVGTVLILWPDITSVLAQKVGVGRGTDLLFYGCVLFFLFTSIAQSQRIHRLEQRTVALTREIALLDQPAREGATRSDG
jgi:hypothetical protein